jgi:hypothetical protein
MLSTGPLMAHFTRCGPEVVPQFFVARAAQGRVACSPRQVGLPCGASALDSLVAIRRHPETAHGASVRQGGAVLALQHGDDLRQGGAVLALQHGDHLGLLAARARCADDRRRRGSLFGGGRILGRSGLVGRLALDGCALGPLCATFGVTCGRRCGRATAPNVSNIYGDRHDND